MAKYPLLGTRFDTKYRNDLNAFIQDADLRMSEADSKANQALSLIEEIETGGSGLLRFNTLLELQSTYPNGTNQPVWVTSENAWYYWDGVIIEEPTDTTAPIVTASLPGGTYNSARIVTLSANETADIFYTLDGSNPTTASAKYSSSIIITKSTTLKFFGRDRAGNQSAVQTVSYVIDTTIPDTTPPVVTVNPSGGTYTGNQTVILSANEIATIYYTLDGTTPIESSLVYSNPIVLSANTTLKYFAKDAAGNKSAVQTQTYTINSNGGSAGAKYLSLVDELSTGDYIVIPPIPSTRIVMDITPHKGNRAAYYFDARIEENKLTGYLYYDSSGLVDKAAQLIEVSVNGQATSGSNLFDVNIPNGVRSVVEATRSDVFSTPITIGGHYLLRNFLTMDVYDIKIFNGSTLMAHYDMTKGDQLGNGKIKDQTGNGNDATLSGGTWVI